VFALSKTRIMPPAIVLHEHEAREVPLGREAYEVLRSRYAGLIDAGPTERRGVYRVAARDCVGRISLPGHMLVIRPKVGVGNLFYMLASAGGAARFFPPPTGLSPNPELFTFVLSALVDRIEHLLRRGLYASYVPASDDLPLVRGRILVGPQLSRHAGLKHRHVCAYADLTPDVPENRVLYAALRLLPALLRPGEGGPLARRVQVLLPRFASVSLVTRSAALALLRGISLHRLNAEYAPALLLARLALQHLTLDETPGPYPFASFLVDMPLLFESFVTEQLRSHLAKRGLRVVAQRYDYLDEARQIGIRPDVLVYRAGGREPALVLDAKYRKAQGEDGLNRDLYQVSAYLDRYRLSRGVLVYPQFGAMPPGELRLRGTYKRLTLLTLDLSAHEPRLLAEETRALAEHVAALL
jgi:5-methylcytosine-specific restriction enzyme subunit McrC